MTSSAYTDRQAIALAHPYDGGTIPPRILAKRLELAKRLTLVTILAIDR